MHPCFTGVHGLWPKDEARELRAKVLRHPPGHVQRTAAYFMSLGHYDALIAKMKRAFQERHTVMAKALRAHGLTIAGRAEFGGSCFWLSAPRDVDTQVLASRLAKRGVLIDPGEVFFDGPERPRHFMRLAYSSIPASAIPGGIAIIAAEIASMRQG